MKKLIKVIFFLGSVLSFAQNNKDIGADFIKTLLVNKDGAKAHTFFDDSIAQQVPTEQLNAVQEQVLGKMGKIVRTLGINNQQENYFYYTQFEKEKLDIQISFNDKNKIIGFFFVPHKEFTEQNPKDTLNIKSDGLVIKGTLLKPTNNDRKNLVILVHGSGATDRNETIGENTPFKDIATYLQDHGISSYRYDKRTFSYPESFTSQSTVYDETINDAVNITNYFKKKEEFRGYNIVVLGHSLGGYLIPLIAQKANADKYIVASGNARPLEEVIVDQFSYLNSLDSNTVSKAELSIIKSEVDFLHSSNFNLKTEKSKLPMGLSAAYWTVLINYKPLQEVKKIKQPILFMQGGRDYQVKEEDFLLWKGSLKDKKNATFQYYPQLSHIYISGSGNPAPSDYSIKRNLDEKFLKDLSDFIIQ